MRRSDASGRRGLERHRALAFIYQPERKITETWRSRDSLWLHSLPHIHPLPTMSCSPFLYCLLYCTSLLHMFVIELRLPSPEDGCHATDVCSRLVFTTARSRRAKCSRALVEPERLGEALARPSRLRVSTRPNENERANGMSNKQNVGDSRFASLAFTCCRHTRGIDTWMHAPLPCY